MNLFTTEQEETQRWQWMLTLWGPSLLILIIGLVTSYLLFDMVYDWYYQSLNARQEDRRQILNERAREFRYQARQRIDGLRSNLNQETESIYAIRQLFLTSEYVDWNNFREFTSEILARNPGVKATFWIPDIALNDLDEFQRATQTKGPPGFDIQNNDNLSGDVRAYQPILYVTPLEENRQWLGIDTTNHPLFSETLSKIKNKTTPLATYTFSSRGAEESREFLLLHNVPRSGTVFYHGGKQITYNHGTVGMLIDIPTIVQRTMSEYDNDRFEIYVEDHELETLYRLGASPDSTPPTVESARPEKPVVRNPLEVFGHTWFVTMVPRKDISVPEITRPENLIREAWTIFGLGILLTVITSIYSFTLLREISRRKEAEEELRRLARHDSLTGLLNRKPFFELLNQEIKEARRYNRALSVAMVDLDHFKEVNDTYGHATGDEVLETTADCLRESARDADPVCRYGGEEFCIALPETSADGAREVVERIRKGLKEQEFQADGDAFTVTCSIGIAELELGSETTADQLLDKADQALYQAKEAGRDRIHVYADEN